MELSLFAVPFLHHTSIEVLIKFDLPVGFYNSCMGMTYLLK